MNKLTKSIIAALLFFAVVSAFFYLLIVGIKSDYSPSMTIEEIKQADLSATLVPLGSILCDWYPEKLCQPEDFRTGHLTPSEKDAMYGTYRMLLPIPAGHTYGITGLTCSYAQRVYVNGVLLSEVGKVSDNPADFVPRTDSYSIFFAPETDQTEIIVQLAHWNNKNGYFNQVYLGEQELVVATSRANFLSAGLIVGTLWAFGVFFFGMFLFYTDKRHLLWFALMCFSSGLYFFIFQNKDIMVLVPNLPWAISHKVEYLSQLSTYVLLLVYTVSVTRLKIVKWQRGLFFALVGGVMLYYIIAPSTFYSYNKTLPMSIYLHTIAFSALYILYRAFREKLCRHSENILVVLCLIAGSSVYLFDFVTDRNYNVMPFGTMLTVFFSAISITLKISRTEQSLNLAQLREKEISETNAMLAHMSKLKSDFLHNIAHEMKTPLTIMSGFAQVADWQVQDGTADESTSSNLKNVCSEAARLGAMVERLSALSFDNDLTLPKAKVNAEELLRYCAELCAPIVHKNNNALITGCEGEMCLFANRDAVLQVLLNLIINANKHTDNGTIQVAVKENDGFAVFTVEDDGSGIAPELLPTIFEKGVSGDQGSGLGLSIAKESIEDNGGIIEVVHTGKTGTCLRFTLPIWKEALQ